MSSAERSPAAARDESRADWMELFFDLVFVALIGQLSGGLRTDPSFAGLGIFLGLFASVWWSWVNLTYAVNIQAGLSRRALAGYMLGAMAAVGVIAVAAPEAVGEHAWLFALGNAALRAILLALWARRSWTAGLGSRLRLLSYNGATAVLWLVSAFLPVPWTYLLWVLAVLSEIVLLVVSAPGLLRRLPRVNIEHLADRFGTLVIIALGESVLSIVLAVSASASWPSGIVAVLALAVTAGIAWSMFMFGIGALRAGLEHLVARGDSRGVVETFAFLPYFLVAGVMMLAGSLSIAIAAPRHPLPLVSAVSLGGGIALAYATNALISLRYGTPARKVLAWALPAILLPAALVPVAVVCAAGWAVGAAALVLLAIVVVSELLAHRVEHRPGDGSRP